MILRIDPEAIGIGEHMEYRAKDQAELERELCAANEVSTLLPNGKSSKQNSDGNTLRARVNNVVSQSILEQPGKIDSAPLGWQPMHGADNSTPKHCSYCCIGNISSHLSKAIKPCW